MNYRARLEEADQRLTEMLRTAMGPAGEFLQDQSVIEIMLNADGRLWIDRLGRGRSDTGHRIDPDDAERIIYLVSTSIGAECSQQNPLLSAELPGCGSRFQGILPPVSQNPVFTIRKKAVMVFSVADYVSQGIMSEEQARFLVEQVKDKQNILIAGGTGSGKTTLANALIDEVSACGDRIVIVEDTRELQSNAEDVIFLRTKDGIATLNDLVKVTMRLRPDRIIVGEVRGAEALDLLKAWNTGHPGGIATIHANGPRQALIRLEQLVQEAVVTVPRALIAEAINIVVYIERYGHGRRVKEIARVGGLAAGEYSLKSI